MRKKLISLLLTGVLTASLLAGCGSTDNSAASENTAAAEETASAEEAQEAVDLAGTETTEEAVEITYANFNASGGNEETLQKMYEAFHDEYPNITVNIETIGYDDYFTQMQTRVAGGTAPDCYELNIENFAAYANKGVLAELTGIDTSGYNATALNAFSVNGKQYGVPGNFSNVVLIYNKDLFDQAGVAYPTDDWTWDDAMDACEKISALGDDIYGIYQPITFNEFFKVAAQYGGGVLNADKTEFTINSEENLKAATMMISKVTDTNVQPTEAQMGGMGDWDLFESGRLGMIPTGIWAFNTFADACDFNWDICVEPGGTQKATHFFSNALVVNADSDKKEAAATWINWLASSDTSAQMRIDAGWDLPAISNEEVLSGYLKLTPPENRQAVFDSLNYLTVAPIIEDYSLMSDIITGKLSLAAGGEITVQEALDQAQEECSAQISLQ
ncbi:sugar ABC transporter substrate-binding protein [Suilimivivens sp.]|uniref:ABC transporter substrate-binding protein n=1 Tax=Suilimivivens sp. TaxID=2981669 RepID=UPI003079E905